MQLFVLLTFSFASAVLSLDLCTFEDDSVVTYFPRNFTTTQCGCQRATCIRKCCKPGFILRRKFCVRNNSSDDFTLPVYTEKNVFVADSYRNDSFLVGVMENCSYFRLTPRENPKDEFYVQENGSLWVPSYNEFFNNEEYCVDEMYGTTVLMCIEESSRNVGNQANVIGMIISMPFLLITFLVYAILPDSNLHRKALMFYVLTLLLAYIFLVTVQLHEGRFESAMCKFLGFSVIFFFITSFFWMNVMCIDMWLAFSGLRGFSGQRHAEWKRFILYCTYAWGVPILLVIVVIFLNEYGNSETWFYPGVGRTKCFLDDNMPTLLYFYGPMTLIIVVNIILFILTAIKIQRVKKETSMLKHSDSKKHSYEDDKQKFNLYLKLLFAMGINWSMEIISWAFLWKLGVDNLPSYVWYLTDFCNAMYGVFIFFIFVFKKKIWKSLQKRYYVFIGKPHLARSLTTTQTMTRSSNFSTTETGLNDHRLSELKNGREERPLTHN